ncbi:MAG: hypothetical protein AB7S26_14720 [Sandaracinaceae bacterium]
MSELLGTTVEEVIQVMKERRVRIPSEIGAFVALEVCEALEAGPAAVRRGDVRIAEDGTISVFAPPGSATSEEAARSVVALLGSLLVAAGTGVPRVLVGLMESGPSSGRWELASLRDDLEASLVPLNRGAARRVLARMLREVRKPRSSEPAPPEPVHRSAPPPTDSTLDAQLDDLLDGEDPPASPPSSPPEGDLDAMLDATLSELDVPSSPPPRRDPEPRPTPAVQRAPAKRSANAASARPAPVFELDRDVPPEDATIADDPPELDAPVRAPVRMPDSDPPPADSEPPPRRRSVDLDDLGSELDKPRRGSPWPWLLAFVAILAATAAAVALMRPDLVDAMLGRPPPPPPDTGPTPEDQERMLREHRARWGTLTVEVRPEDAQVLMFVGRGPAEAVELPVGVAHEFVAVVEGRPPGRAVLPADAEWTTGEDGSRYDLAMQVPDGQMAELALGETLLRGIDLGSPSGMLGTARVITNPPGAKVYLLIGFSPSATIENIPTEEGVEIIAWHEDYPIARGVVGPSDWSQDADGSKHATLSLTLPGYEEPDER